MSLMDKWSPLNIWLSQNTSGNYKSSLRSKRKGKGEGGGGQKVRGEKEEGGLGRREGKGALAATLLFSLFIRS